MTRIEELLAEVSEPGEEARRDAEVLLCRALGKERSYLYAWPEADVEAQAVTAYRAWMEDRARGVPVAYLLGRREFWSHDLLVNEATLIPRPDTEVLVALALSLAMPREARVLDLGTGTGAIAIALASERPEWSITAVEASPDALVVAQENALRCDVPELRFLAGNWFEPVGGESFDLIVSNPPYVSADDSCLNEGDLRYEPRTALVSGADGYADLDAIIAAAPRHLNPGASIVLEHGASQGAGVRERLGAAGFVAIATHRDLAGHERASLGQKTAGA
ncbi:MAG: peptide chain release factor N(5)-glutamine methyltransferase [Pseudomonadota bacterium]